MISFSSYLKIRDDFVLVSEYSGEIEDARYIEGAIVADIPGHRFISLDMWDYVDQLWAYIVDVLVDISHGEQCSTYFPDQPICLTFTPLDRSALKVSRSGYQDIEATVDGDEFVSAAKTSGLIFFKKMKELVPQNALVYGELERKLRSISGRNGQGD